jgi:hypothetical protein
MMHIASRRMLDNMRRENSMRCKVGDLAVVVNAECRCNLGHIVQVVAPHDGTGILRFLNEGQVWIVASRRPMTWYLRGKRYRRKIGPVPDNRLQPIRGLPPRDLVAKPDESDTVLEKCSGLRICELPW